MCNITVCEKYLQEMKNLNIEELDKLFEDLIDRFLRECFGEKFCVYRNKKHYQNPHGIKCLKDKTPDFVIAVPEVKGLESIVDIELGKVKMLIELSVKRDDVNKAWRDCYKYTGINQQLKDNKTAVGYISLFSNDPKDIRIEGEKYPYRWTYAAFLPYQNQFEIPWWIWVTNTPGITDSMKIPGTHGSPIYSLLSQKDPCGSSWNPFFYLYNVINECLTQKGDCTLDRMKQCQYDELPKSHKVNDEVKSAPAMTICMPSVLVNQDVNWLTGGNNILLDNAVIENAKTDYSAFANKMPKVGRNEPCPCGSGKKYKRCCIDRNIPSPS